AFWRAAGSRHDGAAAHGSPGQGLDVGVGPPGRAVLLGHDQRPHRLHELGELAPRPPSRPGRTPAGLVGSSSRAVVPAEAIGVDVAIQPPANDAMVTAEVNVVVPNDPVDGLEVARQAFIDLPHPTTADGLEGLATVQAVHSRLQSRPNWLGPPS